jgi:betaine reductase
MRSNPVQPVIKGVKYFLSHASGMVRYGSKPSREILKTPDLLGEITAHLRSYEEAAAYAPNQVFLGAFAPEELDEIERPWFLANRTGQRRYPHGEIMSEECFYGLLRIADVFDLVWLEEGFAKEVRGLLTGHSLVLPSELDRLNDGQSFSKIEGIVADTAAALPLYLKDGRLVGCIHRAHEEDTSLAADVLLENLACKATAAMALRTLLRDDGLDPESIDYVLNSGEEAVGERYQRGGGNLAKAIGEMCGLGNATGSDVKAFCSGPVHALVMAGALVSSGVFDRVAVVGGCSLAKLGMKFQAHLHHDYPILEDVLASVAVLVGRDDGHSPVLRLDAVGRHTIGAGSSQQAIFEKLVTEPLEKLGLGFRDVDKYATELHNPEVMEPAGSGDVARRNYQVIGALAVLNKEIDRSDIASFVKAHGMPGFSPTQGHIASGIPFLGHALDRIRDGTMQRAMILARGSLFLGRMTQMSDGMSFMIEKNAGERS